MEWSPVFFINSILLGIGLAMDAFSVSLANGLNEPKIKKSRMCYISGVFAFFQFTMPMIGWICIHTIVEYFSKFDSLIPWFSLILLVSIGLKMIFEPKKSSKMEEKKSFFEETSPSFEISPSKKNSFFEETSQSAKKSLLLENSDSIFKNSEGSKKYSNDGKKLTFFLLLVQGIATSIDALSVGFTIADYDFFMAFIASLIIAFVTFLLCMIALHIGKRAGNLLNFNSSFVGGFVLIMIGIEIFIKGMFF